MLVYINFRRNMNSWIQLPKDNTSYPAARWGHSMCKLKNSMMLMFGGYADSVYFNDLWLFDLKTFLWKQLKPIGMIPEPRSNASLVYGQQQNKIIIFGGGASGNSRFCDVWQFQIKEDSFSNIQGNWKKVEIQNKNAPWCRTYHTTQKYKDFMIIYGGEAFGNDLDDIWILNIKNYQWFEVKSIIKPPSRRFHSSAIVGNYLYIFGGCQGSYKCLQDMFRLNLNFLNTETMDGNCEIMLNWEEVIYSCDEASLNRWGHCCCVDQLTIYIFGGRNTDDLNDLLCFEIDQENNKFDLRKLKTFDKPVGRRKGILLNIGSFLCLYGGFNNQYFSQIHLFNTFYIKQLKHKNLNVRLEIQKQFCDIHLTTKDKKIISFVTPLIQSAFSSIQTRIAFFQELAEMNYEQASIYSDFINKGQISSQMFNSIFLSKYQLSLQKNNLLSFKNRILKNVLSKDFSQNSNFYVPLRVSQDEFSRIQNIVQNNPYNNISLYPRNGKVLRGNSFLMSIRSRYMKILFMNKKYKINKSWHDFQLQRNTLNFLIIYFQFGHLILPDNIEISQLLSIYDAADMYCLTTLSSICLQEIKRILFDKPMKKDLQIILQKASNHKLNQNWKILFKYSLAILSSNQIRLEKNPFKNLLNRQFSSLKDKIRKKVTNFSIHEIKEQFQLKDQYKEIQEMNHLFSKCKSLS